jgi:hypothetical protein
MLQLDMNMQLLRGRQLLRRKCETGRFNGAPHSVIINIAKYQNV